MTPSDPGRVRAHWSGGRAFTSVDPERQGEVAGYLCRAVDTATARRPAPPRSSRPDWLRVQPERETANFEGSSSRRSR